MVPRFTFTRLLIITALYGLTLRPISAGIVGDCAVPTLVEDATVNTVVLGYRYSGGNTALQRASATVSLLTLDGLFSQLKYSSNIAVQLFRSAGGDSSIDDPCPPIVIVDRLIPHLKSNHALVILWGSLFQNGDSIFIQNFVEVRRASDNGDVIFSWRHNDQDYWFSAGLPVNLVALPPHEVSQSAIQELSAVYEKIAATHEEPNSTSRSAPLKLNAEEGHPYSFFVDHHEGTWMHLTSSSNELLGWVNAGEVDREWPIRKYLPELDFIDGAVGYLLLQDDREHQNPPQPQWAAFADSALRRFIEATTDKEVGAPALALAKSMQGIIELRQSSLRPVTPELRKVFEDVVKLVPFSSQARNLRAMVDLKSCCSGGPDDFGAQNVINQLMDAVRVEPQDDRSLANLETLYRALGSPNAEQVREVRAALNSGGKANRVAQGAGPTDPQIAHIAYTAGELDIAGAKLALSKSKNKDVRAFAEGMVSDQTAVNEKALALVKKLKVTPEDNDTSRSLFAAAAAKRAELSKLNGAAFDKAYIANEVAYHKTVNGALETTLIPQQSRTQEPARDRP